MTYKNGQNKFIIKYLLSCFCNSPQSATIHYIGINKKEFSLSEEVVCKDEKRTGIYSFKIPSNSSQY
jgi:hypothetical protein